MAENGNANFTCIVGARVWNLVVFPLFAGTYAVQSMYKNERSTWSSKQGRRIYARLMHSHLDKVFGNMLLQQSQELSFIDIGISDLITKNHIS